MLWPLVNVGFKYPIDKFSTWMAPFVFVYYVHNELFRVLYTKEKTLKYFSNKGYSGYVLV